MFEGSKVINEWLHDIHHNDTYTGTGVSWFTCFCFHPFSIGILTCACDNLLSVTFVLILAIDY